MKIYSPKNNLRNNIRSKRTYNYGGYTTRNSTLSFVKRSFFDWIDRNNTFYFQLVGIAILTLALFISFSSLSADAGSVAQAKEGQDGFFVYSTFRNSIKNPETTGQIKPAGVYVEPANTEVAQAAEIVQVQYEYYKVKSGDTLYSVCKKIKVDCEQVKDLNDSEYPYTLSVNTAHYVLVDGTLEPNPRYRAVPAAPRQAPHEIPEHGIGHGRPALSGDLSLLDLVSRPELYPSLWKRLVTRSA